MLLQKHLLNLMVWLGIRDKIPATSVSNEVYQFSDDFMVGVATSAYQVEGAWNVDGKGPNVFDAFLHSHPNAEPDHSNGDVGPNSYYLYEDDIFALKELGVSYYRFSIAWTRILPDGTAASFNQKGIDHYNKFIDRLIENGIEPVVTMCQNDIPQALIDFGGQLNSTFVDYYAVYVNILFEKFSDRVKYWFTFINPNKQCVDGYAKNIIAPGLNTASGGEYLCVHNTLLAHATAYHIYKEKYQHKYNGKVGITLSPIMYYPHPNASNGKEAAERALQFQFGWLAHPIFHPNGNYPQSMIDTIDKNSAMENRTESRLPKFTEEQIQFVKGSSDFMGINFYTSRYAEFSNKTDWDIPSMENDLHVLATKDPKWPQSNLEPLVSYPPGIRDLLIWARNEYSNPRIFLTETGWSDNGELVDNERIHVLKEYLKHLHKAIYIDKCDVFGYGIWSLIDNFEWEGGFTKYFGLYYVNNTSNSASKTRVPKKSSIVMGEFFRTKRIPN